MGTLQNHTQVTFNAFHYLTDGNENGICASKRIKHERIFGVCSFFSRGDCKTLAVQRIEYMTWHALRAPPPASPPYTPHHSN